MARKPRISYPGALHHVIVRGNHKEEIFLHDSDRKRLIELLREYHERYLFECYAYSLMPNHIHLLIEEGNIPLSKIMQGINQSYTQYFNTRYEKVGHLFQGRYKAILVDKERYLLVVVRYIHLNPVRVFLVKKPEDYRWSSHHLYISSTEKSFINKNYVLSLFGNTRKVAVKRYVRFIYEGIGKKTPEIERGILQADDEFIENAIKKYHHRENKTGTTLDEISTFVTKMFSIDEQMLFSKSRARQISFVRGVIAYLARETADITTKEIAQFFNRDPSSITNAIQRVIRKTRKDDEISFKIKQLKMGILKNTK
jgi:REP element-mobilizing transposase RayT